MSTKQIVIKGARVNNLKNISVEIPRDQLVVITGLSGSGKSSLAFDTIYAEGQRRYVESLSAYARQFLGLLDKPDVDSIEGLSPTIAIDQRSVTHNPRSTVGTVTEIYDHLRILYSKVGHPHCVKCGQEVFKQTIDQIAEKILTKIKTGVWSVLAPVSREQKVECKKVVDELERSGYKQVRIDGEIMSLEQAGTVRLDKMRRHSIETVFANTLSAEANLSKQQITEFVKTACDMGDGFFSILNQATGAEIKFSQEFACPKDDITLSVFEPRSFSFNSPQGACASCSGLGTKQVLDPELVIPNAKLSFNQGAIRPWSRIFANQNSNLEGLNRVATKLGFSMDAPVESLAPAQMKAVLFGDDKFDGVIPNLERKHLETDSDYVRSEIEKYMRVKICSTCNGKRLREESLRVTVAAKPISELVNMSITDLHTFFEALPRAKNGSGLSDRENKIADQLIREVLIRCQLLIKVGLNYLTLDRTATTLSGGEAQRIRLATQIGAMLVGVVYVLDEPSIGLHQKDNDQLIETLIKLRELGNTVIVVEHDEATIRAADLVIDMGPGAGGYGGQIVAVGTASQIMQDKKSLTGQYLSGALKVEVPEDQRKGNGKEITIKGAKAFNLKNIDVSIPLGKFVCITGVSGSGKSTLVTEILAKALSHHFYRSKDLPGEHKKLEGLENIDKVIDIDQSPIGRTPRSNPATYTGVFTYIRDLFIDIPEARIKGFKAGHFSFNVKGGRCETCQGEGMVKIEMQFLQDVYVQCEECKGKRYQSEALEVYYKGKNIADILEMTVSEARTFFSDNPIIYEKLDTLYEVGLGYLKLGQSATTLSGGEAQRIKLATELSRRATGKTLYILDEPTTGLHFDDVKRLLAVLNRLVDKGNSILVIEHNIDVIKSADWVIDLGPDGGDKGGHLVAAGTPNDVARVKESYTGQYLKKALEAGGAVLGSVHGASANGARKRAIVKKKK